MDSGFDFGMGNQIGFPVRVMKIDLGFLMENLVMSSNF